jgi:hypothetical protein
MPPYQILHRRGGKAKRLDEAFEILIPCEMQHNSEVSDIQS